MPSNPLARKLQLFVRLSPRDLDAIDRIVFGRVRQFRPREDVMREGDAPDRINLFLSGWAVRYKEMENGRRQILAYFLPGDLCDLNVFVLREMDHSIATLTAASVAEIFPTEFEDLIGNHPRITQALWWESLVNHAVQREWTVNLGQRSAVERIAHLFCELFVRLQSVGLASGGSCEWPITQAELGETTGLSSVHVNRTLQELRAQNLIVLERRTLTIPDLGALKRIAMFNDNYLHLDREGRYLDANE